MAEQTGAQQQEKPRSRAKPARKHIKRKQLISIRHGAADMESAEDRATGSGLFEQRPAVRRLSGDVVSPAPTQARARTESRFAHDFSRLPTHTIESPQAIQRAKPTRLPQCGPTELFAELKMPWYMRNQYYRGSIWMSKSGWKSALVTAKKGQCTAEGKFEGIKLKWDLGNPKLGSFFGININKNDIKFGIDAHLVYPRSRHGKKCGTSFSGTASWSFNVMVTRKMGGRVESGMTRNPIEGRVSMGKGGGAKSCAIDQKMVINMPLEYKKELKGKIIGEVQVKGATYSG